MTYYGTIPTARGLTPGDRAVFVPTGETVRVLRIEARLVKRTVRPFFEVQGEGWQGWRAGWKIRPGQGADALGPGCQEFPC